MIPARRGLTTPRRAKSLFPAQPALQPPITWTSWPRHEAVTAMADLCLRRQRIEEIGDPRRHRQRPPPELQRQRSKVSEASEAAETASEPVDARGRGRTGFVRRRPRSAIAKAAAGTAEAAVKGCGGVGGGEGEAMSWARGAGAAS
jgi:hypothetical protein